MRIKKFEAFKTEESLIDIKDNIRDICLDLIDVGFDIRFTKNDRSITHGLTIFFPGDRFYLSSIDDVILRIKVYLGGRYFDCRVRSWGSQVLHDLGRHKISEGISEVLIEFSVYKFFKESKIQDDIIEDLNDILQELEDNGFLVNKSIKSSEFDSSISIEMSSDSIRYEVYFHITQELLDCIIRVDDYLKSKGMKIKFITEAGLTKSDTYLHLALSSIDDIVNRPIKDYLVRRITLWI